MDLPAEGEDVHMGELYDVCQGLMRQIESTGKTPMDQILLKGQAASHAGFMVSLVSPRDPDDPTKIEAVRSAARSMGFTL